MFEGYIRVVLSDKDRNRYNQWKYVLDCEGDPEIPVQGTQRYKSTDGRLFYKVDMHRFTEEQIERICGILHEKSGMPINHIKKSLPKKGLMIEDKDVFLVVPIRFF